jgi:predicted secreted acid phosphatase
MKNLNMLTNTLFAISCTLILSSKSFAEPMNIGQLKTELRTYQASGTYNQELAQVINDAKTYIAEQVAANQQANPKKKLAIVLDIDIDETSLSNYNQIDAQLSKASDPAIQPTLALYQDAIKQGVYVFFVTGRYDSLTAATIKNLKAAGFEGWTGLYFRPKTDTQSSVVPYKTQALTAIEQAGYTIIASIGDQESDLAGGHAAQTFKVPNPYYYLP